MDAGKTIYTHDQLMKHIVAVVVPCWAKLGKKTISMFFEKNFFWKPVFFWKAIIYSKFTLQMYFFACIEPRHATYQPISLQSFFVMSSMYIGLPKIMNDHMIFDRSLVAMVTGQV